MLKKIVSFFKNNFPEEFAVSYDGLISEARIGSKQNDVVFDKFGGESSMLANNGQNIDNEDHSDERKAADAHTRLLNQIKTVARPFQRPVLNFHTPTEIHVRAALYQIFDLVRFFLSSNYKQCLVKEA